MHIPRVVTVSIVFLALTSQAFAQQTDRERYDIVWAYGEKSAADKRALMVARTPEEAAAAADKVTFKTDQAFQLLTERQLLDSKLAAYKTYWGRLKLTLVANPRDELTVAQLVKFGSAFVNAAKGNGCTIVVSASNGEGAIVHYAKAQDADLGRGYKQLPGATTIISEVERAEYRFKSYRNGRETGQTAPVACTNVSAPVKVVINE